MYEKRRTEVSVNLMRERMGEKAGRKRRKRFLERVSERRFGDERQV